MQRQILATAIALALWPSLALGVEVSVFHLVGHHNARSEHKDMKRLTCYPDGTTREDGLRALVAWVPARQDDPKLMNEAPVIGPMRFLNAQWPGKRGQ